MGRLNKYFSILITRYKIGGYMIMERFLVFFAILGSLIVFACTSNNNPGEHQGEEFSSSSSEEELSSSSSSEEEVPLSSSDEAASSSSSEESSSSSSAKSSSSSSEAVSSSSSAKSSSSSSAKSSSSSSVVASSSSSAKSSSSSSAKSSSSSSESVSSSSSAKSSSSSATATDPKENFHIYLAFGQSNMEGQCSQNNNVVYNDVLPDSYKTNVDSRFQVMTAVAGSYKLANNGSEQRAQGKWYTAVPPLVRNNLCLSPVDYFGRTIVAKVPDIKVGIIVVAVGGAAIEGFGKTGAADYYKTQESWMQNSAANYGNDPYKRLVDLAKEAQKVGVIKGILMHQGESGAANGNYSQKVKAIYDNILSDLGLPANSVPFLAGQAVGNNNGNISSIPGAMGKMPNGKDVGYVIPSNGLSAVSDNLHFTYDSYKTLGERYGQKMLELLY